MEAIQSLTDKEDALFVMKGAVNQCIQLAKIVSPRYGLNMLDR